MNLNLSNSGNVCTAASPCPGYANNTIQWDSSQLQGDFGVNTAARDARQIQYGLKIDF